MALFLGLTSSALSVGPGSGPGLDPKIPGSPGCSPSLPPGSPGTPPPDSALPQPEHRPPQNLTDRLARSDGVICPPPNVDPDMKLPTPDAGPTPVIPPPGSDDPTLRPK